MDSIDYSKPQTVGTWQYLDPIVPDGVVATESGHGNTKTGNGVLPWTRLPWDVRTTYVPDPTAVPRLDLTPLGGSGVGTQLKLVAATRAISDPDSGSQALPFNQLYHDSYTASPMPGDGETVDAGYVHVTGNSAGAGLSPQLAITRGGLWQVRLDVTFATPLTDAATVRLSSTAAGEVALTTGAKYARIHGVFAFVDGQELDSYVAPSAGADLDVVISFCSLHLWPLMLV